MEVNTESSFEDILKVACQIRKDSIWMSTIAGKGHLSPALSLAEILATLYKGVLKFNPHNPEWLERDRLILSKGHGCLALYSILSQMGYFDRTILKDFCGKFDTLLPGHPERKLPGVEANTGSLGHGIALGMGMALAAKIDQRNYKVFVVTGDGELQEGSNWEAAMSASSYNLENLIVIVDRNRLQLGGFTERISKLEPLKNKWEAFGWGIDVVDGHSAKELISSFQKIPLVKSRPSVIICNTIKGKGLYFAENKVEWHYKVLTKLQYEEQREDLALEALDREG